MQTDKQPNNPKQKDGPVTAPLPNGAGAYALNDLYHARRFVEFYGQHVRYCRTLGGFLTWNGRYWTPDETGQVWRWIIHTASQAYRADFAGASDHERLRLNKWSHEQKHAEASKMPSNNSAPNPKSLPDLATLITTPGSST